MVGYCLHQPRELFDISIIVVAGGSLPFYCRRTLGNVNDCAIQKLEDEDCNQIPSPFIAKRTDGIGIATPHSLAFLFPETFCFRYWAGARTGPSDGAPWTV